jgi:uncharacterized phage protein gp47/JayE
MPTTPVAYVDATGIHVPPFEDILGYFRDAYRTIYGSDVYLDNDSQDGQLLGLFATAINDANAGMVSAYNSFSPATAQGVSLSRVVKQNGIERKKPTQSTAQVYLVGVAGTVIENGIVQDDNGVQWSLPPTVTIALSGEVIATATCLTPGAVEAPIGFINKIVTTRAGWQSVSNHEAAALGDPIETDAQLRRRQKLSTEIPSEGLLAGLAGALWELPNVRDVTVYENTGGGTDARGIPGKSIAVVIDGGDVNQIAAAIANKKGAGVATAGTTAIQTTDTFGVPHTIRFYRPTLVPITWLVSLTSFEGYTINTEQAIAQALADWVNGLGVGRKIAVKRAYVPANLFASDAAETFELTGLAVARDGEPTADEDVQIGFFEQPISDPSYVQFHYPPGV